MRLSHSHKTITIVLYVSPNISISCLIAFVAPHIGSRTCPLAPSYYQQGSAPVRYPIDRSECKRDSCAGYFGVFDTGRDARPQELYICTATS